MGHRRMPWTLRTMAALSALAMLVVGCDTNDAQEASREVDSERRNEAADSTAATERLVYAVPPPQAEGTNPQRDFEPSDEFQLKPMYENLIGIDPETGAWIPMLAESWESEGDAVTFHLREGVPFHNDFGEFTAQDVVLAFEDLTEPEGSLAPSSNTLRSTVQELEVVGDHEIVFHLTEANYAFLEGLGYGAAGMAIKSKADWDSRQESPGLSDEPIAGTGPYRFLERTPGVNVVFERVEDHWRQTPDFRELEYRFVGENSTRFNAVRAGEAHLTDLPSDLTAAAADEGLSVIRSAQAGRRIGVSMMGCYYADPPDFGRPAADVFTSDERKFPDSPMCDITVRQAINKAIDRDALNEAFYEGQAEKLVMWYWLPELAGWNPEWQERWQEVYGYDPEAATQLLEEAGYGPGELTIEVLATQGAGGTEAADVMEAIAGMLSDVGFDVEILSMDENAHYETRGQREFQRTLEFDSTSSENITGFEAQGYGNHPGARAIEDVDMDTEYEAVLQELDPEKQAVLWEEFGNKVFDKIQHVPLVRTYSDVVADPDVVCGYTFPGASMSTDYSFVEYVESC